MAFSSTALFCRAWLHRLAIVLLVVGFIASRVPLLWRQLHPDEQHTLVNHCTGYHPVSFPGPWLPEGGSRAEMSFSMVQAMARAQTAGPPVVVPWSRTLFRSEWGNNPVPATALARLGNDAWRCWNGIMDRTRANRVALRLPSLVISAINLGALVCLATMALGRWPGLLAGAVFCVHPLAWHFSTLMRGYAMLLLAITLSWWFYRRALARGDRWAWWWGALCTAWALWAFPGYGYVAVVLQGWLGIHVFRQDRGQFRSWATAHVVAALLWTAIALPSFMDAVRLMRDGYPFASHSPWWTIRVMTTAMAGVSVPSMQALPLGATRDIGRLAPQAFQDMPWALAWSVVLMPVLVLLGLRTLHRRGETFLACACIISICGTVACVLHQLWQGHELMPWYGVALVPVVSLCLAAPMSKGGPWRAVFAWACLAGLAWTGYPDMREGRLELFPVRNRASAGYIHSDYAVLTMPDGRNLLARPTGMAQPMGDRSRSKLPSRPPTRAIGKKGLDAR